MRPFQVYSAFARVSALRVGVLRRLSSRNGAQDLVKATAPPPLALLRSRAAAETARATADVAAVSARAAAETAALSSRATADVAAASARAATEFAAERVSLARSIAVLASFLIAGGWLVLDLYTHEDPDYIAWRARRALRNSASRGAPLPARSPRPFLASSP